MARISHAEQMLMAALNDLERDWGAARVDWRDQARIQFEEYFVDELTKHGRTAARAMAELTVLLKKVVRECR